MIHIHDVFCNRSLDKHFGVNSAQEVFEAMCGGGSTNQLLVIIIQYWGYHMYTQATSTLGI